METTIRIMYARYPAKGTRYSAWRWWMTGMGVSNDRDICLVFVPHSLLASNFPGRLSSARHVQPVIDGQIRNDSAVHLSQSTSAFRQTRTNDSDDAVILDCFFRHYLSFCYNYNRSRKCIFNNSKYTW